MVRPMLLGAGGDDGTGVRGGNWRWEAVHLLWGHTTETLIPEVSGGRRNTAQGPVKGEGQWNLVRRQKEEPLILCISHRRKLNIIEIK